MWQVRHPVTLGRARRGVCTVQKRHIIFLVSFNGAEFPMPNQRRNASSPNTVNCTVRKYLTAREIEKLMDYARKHSRYGHRDSTMILVVIASCKLATYRTLKQGHSGAGSI